MFIRTPRTTAPSAAQMQLVRTYQRAWAVRRFTGRNDASPLLEALARDGLVDEWGTGWAWDVIQEVWGARTHPDQLLPTLMRRAAHPVAVH